MINRELAPVVTVPSELNVKCERRITTREGVDIYALEFPEYDVMRVSFVFRAGTKYQSKSFCATTVASMLSEGCEGVSSREIAEILDFYGIYFDHAADRDNSVITICCLERFFDKSIELLGKILSSPTFPAEEFEIYKNKKRETLAIYSAKIDYVARETFAKVLFGESHYYGVSVKADELDKLQIDDLKEYYNKHYTRSNMFVVMSGKVTQQHIDSVSSVIAMLPVGVSVEVADELPVSSESRTVEWQGATQSVIRIGRLLFTKEHPDFVPMQVVATILGGYFGSRLISNLREDKGYTYGIFAGMINLEDCGYFAISTEVGSDVTNAAVEEIYSEIERLRVELVSDEELDVVKRVMAGEMMRVLDGPFGIADITIENILNGRSNSYINEQLREIVSITPEVIRDMAVKYLSRDSFVSVIVGA